MSAQPTQAPVCNGLLPYSGMTCESSDWGIHFKEWTEITFPSPMEVSKVEVYYWSGQRCCTYKVQYLQHHQCAIHDTWRDACSLQPSAAGVDTCADAFGTVAIEKVQVDDLWLCRRVCTDIVSHCTFSVPLSAPKPIVNTNISTAHAVTYHVAAYTNCLLAQRTPATEVPQVA
eukprot:gene631-biopygen98516